MSLMQRQHSGPMSRLETPEAPTHIITKADPPAYTFGELVEIANFMASSGLIKGADTPARAFSLIMFAVSQGIHPGAVLARFHVVENSPTMKADVMQAEFQADGGRVEWIESNKEVAEANFSHATLHPKPFNVRITLQELIEAETALSWDKHSQRMVLKGTYRKNPAAMLRARAVTAGIRAVHPGAAHGIYCPEELDTVSERIEVSATPPPPPPAKPPASTGLPAPKPADAVALGGWQKEEFDPRPYHQVVKEEVEFLIRHEQSEGRELVLPVPQVHNHLFKAAVAAGHATKPEGSVKLSKAIELNQLVYESHRDWLRDELIRYLASKLEGEPETAPAEPRREPGQDG